MRLKKMEIKVNGQTEQVDDGFNLSDYLSYKKLDPGSVVVELNLAVVPKENYQTCNLTDKDILEIVQFVGGG
jgi:thiamine biosynthesis protein ThiS